LQRTLSVTSGILIIAIAITSLMYPKISHLSSGFSFYTRKIKFIFKNLFGKKSRTTLFLIGIVNGLLPCGFVYLSLAAALSSGNVVNSIAYMVLFGLGTVPMMFGFSLAGKFFGNRFSKYVRRFSPYAAMLLASLLIYRGLMVTSHSCCHH
jgi:sulfite exporter TauE/SafE